MGLLLLAGAGGGEGATLSAVVRSRRHAVARPAFSSVENDVTRTHDPLLAKRDQGRK